MFGPSGFWTMAPLRYAAKFDPFLSLDCAPMPSTLAQSKERKGSNFAIWQPWLQSTQTQPLSSTNFLQELDRVTKEIVAAVLAEQKAGSAVEGDEISVPGTNQKFALTHRVTLAELGRTELFSMITFTHSAAILTYYQSVILTHLIR